MSCSNDCKSNGVFAFSCLENLLQTSWSSLDPRRPVSVLITSIFLPFFRGMLAAYICLVSSRPSEWGRLLHMLTAAAKSLQSCPTLCNPMNCRTPGLPVHHHLSEFTQTHVHRVSDAIHPSHPLSSPSPPAFNLSQHQGLFK